MSGQENKDSTKQEPHGTPQHDRVSTIGNTRAIDEERHRYQAEYTSSM